MKHLIIALAAALTVLAAPAEHLVILATNDTHSQIDPAADGLGGVARRAVLIDSVRQARDNVLLVDAGDAVQGTLYFNAGGGRAEEAVMQRLGYDMRILGNHEFDNGSDSLGRLLADSPATWLSTNYYGPESPVLSRFKKYDIRPFGDKRVGFIALNLRPRGMIAEGNYDGVEYLDAIATAQATADYLRQVKGVDYVVALSHLGFTASVPPSDTDLARQTSGIDLIIGGHSHTTLDTAVVMTNAKGQPVKVVQTGSRGKALGYIDIDLDDGDIDYRLIPVDSRLDSRITDDLGDILGPYRRSIDSLMTRQVGYAAVDLDYRQDRQINWVSDVVRDLGRDIAPGVDFAIMNKGGLRTDIPHGPVTEGQIIQMMPFNNRIRVIDILGRDLRQPFDQMAATGGNGVSSEVAVTYDPKAKKALSISVNGQPLQDDRTYRVATIDYLANGGDYMTGLTQGTQVAEIEAPIYKVLTRYLEEGPMKGRKIKPDTTQRMRPIK